MTGPGSTAWPASLGHPQLDRHLEFVAARSRPNTVLATASDLKLFFASVGKEPLEVTTADVMAFIAAQRAPRAAGRIVRLADGETGLSAHTIKRRLSSVSGLYAYLMMVGEHDHNPHEERDGVGGPWDPIALVRPELAATAERYLTQLSVSLRPASVTVAGIALRQFCLHLIETHPEVRRFSQVERPHAESFKAELAQRRTFDDKGLKPNTVRLRLLCLRSFFDRLIEWGWPEAPARPPLFLTDVPPKDEPLPKALDDAAAARFMKAAAEEEDPRRQLVVELLARTGMRVGELCALRGDAMEHRDGQWWLRIPLGKLHTDRYVPLHPRLVELLTAWRTHHDDGGTGLLLTNDGLALNRHVVTRMVRRVARAAGIGHVHPHQLRHTLATQAINRGMRLEAIGQMLGHRSLEMTAIYARIADRTVADEYRSVSERVEALYAPEPSAETVAMRRLRHEHRRLLGNGWCTRPREMDCSFESVCEGRGFFATTVEFKPTLIRQRDHAKAHDLRERAAVFDELLEGLAGGGS